MKRLREKRRLAWPPEKVARLVRLVKEGVPSPALAETFCCSETGVRNQLKRMREAGYDLPPVKYYVSARAAPKKTELRPCMNPGCGKPFQSTGKMHRFCGACRAVSMTIYDVG